MDARGDRTAGIIDGDAPEVAMAEGKRPCFRQSGIMEVETVFRQIFEEIVVVFPSEELEKFGAGLGNVDVPPGLVVAQPFAGGAMVSAQVSIGFDRGTIGMEGIDIGAHGTGFLVAGIVLNTVEDGSKTMCPKKLLVFDENVGGGSSFGAQGKGIKQGVVEAGDFFDEGKMLDDLAEITMQRALPAKGVDAVSKRRADQFIETFHHFDAGIGGRKGERRHARSY